MDTTECPLAAKEFIPGNFNPLSTEVSKYVLQSIAPGIHRASQEPPLQTISCKCKQTEGRDETYLNSEKAGTEKCITYCGVYDTFTALSLPPRYTTVRVNLLRTTLGSARSLVEHHLQTLYEDTGSPLPLVYPHYQLPDLLVIEARGAQAVTPASKEVVVGKMCGSAVLRGAEVFAPGVQGCTPDIQVGDRVGVYADLDECCLRGSKAYSGRKMFIGNGMALKTRRELFTPQKCSGVAVKMKEQIFHSPTLSNCFQDKMFLQNLPSVVCSHTLKLEKHSVVLDMCAAPGGKTTHIATLMCNTGQVIAIDRSQNKVDQIMTNAERLGLTNIESYRYDSTKLVMSELIEARNTTQRKGKVLKSGEIEHTNNGTNYELITNLHNSPILNRVENKETESGDDGRTDSNQIKSSTGEFPVNEMNLEFLAPPYHHSSFSRILLDAPCSALGQRPQLHTKMSIKELQSFPNVQRSLLQSAVALLKPGGRLVYSTCTVTSEENEKMVRWVLDRYSDIVLVDSEVELGRPGLPHCGLDRDHCGKVRRFGPTLTQETTAITQDTTALTQDRPTTALTQDSTALAQDTMALTQDITALTQDRPTTAHTQDSTALAQDTMALTQDITALTQDTTALTQDTTALTQDTTALTQDTTALTQDTTALTQKPSPGVCSVDHDTIGFFIAVFEKVAPQLATQTL